MTKGTIRFEDLGEPIQKLLQQLRDGYTEDDMQLMEYVSVKDMAKIYNDLNEMKRAETIWKELKKELQNRKLTEIKQQQDAELSKEQAKAKRKRIKALEREIQEAEEKEQALEEERKRKKEERKAKKAAREKARQEAEEAEAAAAAAAEEVPEEEDPAEAKARRKAARRKAREEAVAAEEIRRAEEEAEQEEEQRLLAEKKARKEERRKRREEAAALQEETERLDQQALEVQQKREEKAARGKTLQKQWLDHVKDHPLEFGDDNGEDKLVQVSLNHNSKPPPKEFLKIKRVKITSVEDSEEAAFYNCEFIMHVGKPKASKKRYSQFLNLKTQLGATIIEVDAPFPGKTFMKVKGSGLEKRKQDLEIWINQVIEKLATTRSYADVQLKQQLRGDAARAEAERQRMQKAAVARQCLHEFCEILETDSP